MPVSSNYFSLPASTTVRTTVEACFRQVNPRTYLRAVVSLEIEMATIRSNAPLNLSHRSERCRDIDSHPRLRSSFTHTSHVRSDIMASHGSRRHRLFALTSRTRGASHYRRALRYVPRGVQSGRPKARAGSRRRAWSDLNMKWLGPRALDESSN
jgi:hypothetical protein